MLVWPVRVSDGLLPRLDPRPGNILPSGQSEPRRIRVAASGRAGASGFPLTLPSLPSRAYPICRCERIQFVIASAARQPRRLGAHPPTNPILLNHKIPQILLLTFPLSRPSMPNHLMRTHFRKSSEAGFSRFGDYQDWNRSVMELSQSCQIIKSRKSCFRHPSILPIHAKPPLDPFRTPVLTYPSQVIVHLRPGSENTRPNPISIQVATRTAVDCPRPF